MTKMLSRPDSTLARADYIAMAAFRYELRKFLRFSKEYLTTMANLTPEQYETLLAIKSFASHPGLPVGQLSECLQVRQHTTVALTNKLVTRGLVTKKRSPTDRRQVFVQLTKKGTSLLSSVVCEHRQALRARSPKMIEALSLLRT
jgi:DNA-binding MarR family transcriptional regulator